MYDLSKKEKMIENIAKFIVNNGVEDLAEVAIEALMPASYLLGRLGYITAFPWIYVLFGEKGEDYSNLIGLEFQDHMPKVIKRVRELREEKDKFKLEKQTGELVSLKLKLKRTINYLFPTTFLRWLQKKLRGSSD